MKNKYYTPSIDEFFQGFEYEIKETFGDGTVKTQEQYDASKWVKEKYSGNMFPYIDRALSGRNAENGRCGIRVKHLDREDIEDLGFICEIVPCGQDTEPQDFGIRRKDETAYIGTFFSENDVTKERNIELCGNYFKVKNKSEFKKLLVMSMLNIK